ncbi:hypothetical protein Y032_0136g1974 [Ancylostoma ceylanicum]|uniref:Reverse transcriptase domain-containing protein n=1 Tax=Ancylostoma ceylanicum TaxID=53326 RepID=A0A016T587_9BILA|nr:hypothetical protein Y032_0136g1974 [Ancylostoma ceylanicum]
MISFKLSQPFNKVKPQACYLDFARGDYDTINEHLLSINWREMVAAAKSADDCYQHYVQCCTDLITQYVPVRFSARTLYPIRIRKLQSFVNTLYKTRNLGGKQKYLRFSRKLKRELAKYHLVQEERIASSRNPKALYRFVNKRLKASLGIGSLRNPEGILCRSEVEKAEVFAEHFKSFYKEPIQDNPPCPHYTTASLDFIDINSEVVYRTLSRLPSRTSFSPDSIPYIFLKRAALGLTTPLTLLFNRFLLHGEVPSIWRLGIVKPIFKKGCRSSVNNYRPVCLTSSTSKVLERIVREQIDNYLASNQLLSKAQHGFSRKRSTTTALMTTIPFWQQIVDRKGYVTACYVDYSKAFDSIPLNFLFEKLEAFGITGCLLEFIKSFLNNRYQKVYINGSYSESYATPSGVPQGTCLGPLMFLLYINDLPNALPPNVTCSMYADDCKIYSINCYEAMQPALDALEGWSRRWQLSISKTKTTLMLIGQSHPKTCRFFIDGQELHISNSVCDLGVTYSNTLSFEEYINKCVRLAFVKSNHILRAFSTKNLETLFKLFVTYVRPTLEYCAMLWSPLKQQNVDSLEEVQKKYTWRIFARNGLFRIPYQQRLSHLKNSSLQLRRCLIDLCFLYKIVFGEVDMKIDTLFSLSEFNSRTRGHRFRFVLPKAHSQQFRSSFMVRVIRIWNQLPASIIQSSSPSTFHMKLSKYLKDRGFT